MAGVTWPGLVLQVLRVRKRDEHGPTVLFIWDGTDAKPYPRRCTTAVHYTLTKLR